MSYLSFILSACLALTSVLTCGAQIRTVSAEKLAKVASPRLSRDSAALAFDTRHIKAGQMSADDAPSVYRYRLTNAGDGPLEIKRLTTTCSCVTATCSRTSLRPSETTEIVVRYDPEGHSGRFERKIFVYTQDGDDPAAVLRLSVDVTAGSDLSDEYPVQMGHIRLRRAEVMFIKGEKAVEKIRFVNIGKVPVSLECERVFLPECLDFTTRPEMTGPDEEGEMVISYDPEKGGEKAEVPVVIKGLGVPPRQSSIKVKMKL